MGVGVGMGVAVGVGFKVGFGVIIGVSVGFKVGDGVIISVAVGGAVGVTVGVALKTAVGVTIKSVGEIVAVIVGEGSTLSVLSGDEVASVSAVDFTVFSGSAEDKTRGVFSFCFTFSLYILQFVNKIIIISKIVINDVFFIRISFLKILYKYYQRNSSVKNYLAYFNARQFCIKKQLNIRRRKRQNRCLLHSFQDMCGSDYRYVKSGLYT